MPSVRGTRLLQRKERELLRQWFLSLPHTRARAPCPVDKLGLKIKNLLREQGVPPNSVPVVFSSEKATRKLASLSGEQRDNPDEFGAVPHFRLRVIPVLGTMPAMFGQAMAAKVMTDIAGCPLTCAAPARAWLFTPLRAP